MKPTVAIIGGTGIGERLAALPGKAVHVPTERGLMRGRVWPAWRWRGQAGGGEVVAQAVYVNVNGPRYETPAEIRMFVEAGGDVVGMTAGSEAIAMREAGVGYGCLAIITNLAAGLREGE